MALIDVESISAISQPKPSDTSITSITAARPNKPDIRQSATIIPFGIQHETRSTAKITEQPVGTLSSERGIALTLMPSRA